MKQCMHSHTLKYSQTHRHTNTHIKDTRACACMQAQFKRFKTVQNFVKDRSGRKQMIKNENGRRKRKKKKCAVRESNPGRKNGNLA